MTTNETKQLLQNLLFTSKYNKLTKDDIINKFPEFVQLTKEAHPDGLHLYRMLKLKENYDLNNLREFKCSESTTDSIRSLIQISDSMSTVLLTNEGTIILEPHLFSFNVPKDNILLDIDLILPEIKNKLKNHLNNKISQDKFGNTIRISEAFEEIEYSNEREFMTDLRGLDYNHLNLGSHAGFSLSCNLSQIERSLVKKFDRLSYQEELPEQYNLLKNYLNKKDNDLITNYAKQNNIVLDLEEKVEIRTNLKIKKNNFKLK